MIQDLVGYRLPLVTRILVSGWLPVTTGYQNLGLRLVTGYHWLPEFGSQVGYRLPLVTRILVSRWLPVTTGYHNFSLRVVPVTTGYQNFRIRVVTGYYWLPLFRSQINYRLPLVTKFDDLDRLPSVTDFSTESGYQIYEFYCLQDI